MISATTRRLRSIAIIVASASVMALSLFVIFVLIYPFDIIRDWRLTVISDNPNFVEGSTIQVRTQYTKIIDAPAEIHRNIECRNDNGSLQVYPISTQNSPSSNGDKDLVYSFTIPSDVINGLPTECRISVDAVYQLYVVRTVVEHTSSDFFTVTPRTPRQ